MWHLHWRADAARRSSIEPVPAQRTRPSRGREAPPRGSFQYVWHDTPAASVAADVPESVRVRGR
jgi:hypothetical protein